MRTKLKLEELYARASLSPDKPSALMLHMRCVSRCIQLNDHVIFRRDKASAIDNFENLKPDRIGRRCFESVASLFASQIQGQLSPHAIHRGE